MNSGGTFGEMMNDINQNNILNKRLVTIITNEDCDFGTLDKDEYNKCLKEVSEKMRKSKLNFLLQMKIFNNLKRPLDKSKNKSKNGTNKNKNENK